MKIKKGTLLTVKHNRTGTWTGIATKDFDTDKEVFYPIALAQEKSVAGMVNEWVKGEEIPCRNSLCKIEYKSENK